MARIVDRGLAKEDDPMFSRPLWIGTARRLCDYHYVESMDRTSEYGGVNGSCQENASGTGGISE